MRFELKLRDIQLKNFRLFDEVRVNFDDKLTVLIGENGAGKTSLLEGIAAALNAVILRLRKNTTELDEHKYYALTDVKYGQDAILTDMNLEQIFEDDEDENTKMRILELAEIDKEYQERFDELNKNLQNSTTNTNEAEFWRNEIDLFEKENREKLKSVEDRFGKQIEAENIRYRLNPTYREDIQKELFEEENISRIEEIALLVDKNRKEKKEISLPVIAYYPCERIITSSKNGIDETYGMNMFNAYDHALDGLSLSYKRFLEWYDWQDRIGRANKSNKVLDIVKQAILDVLNDPEDKPFKSIEIDPTEFKNPRLMLLKEDSKVEATQLSSGEKSLMMLVSNLAYRLALLNPFSKDPLQEGHGIVLIDEIDLHLHPRWQRAVIPKLQSIFPNIQFVITTHSPLVLTHSTNGKAIRLNDGTLTEYKRYKGMRLVDIFYDLYDTTSRPKGIQDKIDRLFEEIENENWRDVHIKLNELKEILPENDPAIIEAQTTLDLVEL